MNSLKIVKAVLLVLALLLKPSLLEVLQVDRAQAAHCLPNTVVMLNPTVDQQLTGIVRLRAKINGPGTPSKVTFLKNGPVPTYSASGFIADGVQEADPTVWFLDWDTRTTPDGEYKVSARAIFGGEGTSSEDACHAFEVRIFITNTSPPPPYLVLHLEPGFWEGPPNTSVTFRARAYMNYSDGSQQDVTLSAAFTWGSTIGTIAPAHNLATFSSGQVTGPGFVGVVANYTNLSTNKSAAINIVSGSTSSSPAPPPLPSGSAAVIPPFSGPPSSLGPALEACLRKVVGDQRFESINSGQSRPTADEMEMGWQCFSQRRFNVPPSLSPIEPAKVRTLPKAPQRLKIDQPKNITVTSTDGSAKTTLVLSGVATPNKTVFIYIFSDPLVLIAKTDNRGNWSYTLEDPLEPGSHEVYVAMEDEPNEYISSDPFFIDVARAQPTADNPTGASLVLDDGSSAQRQNFLIFAGISILIALLSMLILLRRFRVKPPPVSQSPSV